MSHDADKLIRQLSLVAFLMAERRPVTARDVKSNVEGYSEMSDEAFARRYYADRSELTSLGVPLRSQRDEFTGEELYTLRSEQYFLPPLELTNDELAALQTSFYLLEGKFAYAEPLRLALQNLALGRPGFSEPPTATAVRVEVLDPDYSPETPGRLGKLEAAISKQRTVKFSYWSISRDELSERVVNPYGLLSDNGLWYVVGHDLRARCDAHLPRLAHPQRHPLRHPQGARLPHSARLRHRRLPRSRPLADRPLAGRGEDPGRAGDRLVGRARLRKLGPGRERSLHDRVLLATPARLLDPAPGRPGGCRSSPRSCARRSCARSGLVEAAPQGRAARAGAGAKRASREHTSWPTTHRARSPRSGSRFCRPCSPTSSPPAAIEARP